MIGDEKYTNNVRNSNQYTLGWDTNESTVKSHLNSIILISLLKSNDKTDGDNYYYD